MRKLNGKNKFYIFVFSLLIILIITIIIFAIKLSNKNEKEQYDISSNSVVFDSSSNLIDTSLNGQIVKKYNEEYFYVNSINESFNVGNRPVIYDKTKDQINIIGSNYQVFENGDISENERLTTAYMNNTNFYKLDDRVYLIVAKEIYNEDKSIYANKYLMIYIDKQGNASLLNDLVNVKTINPLILKFDSFTFDIANEKIIIKDHVIDLKKINGSTNQYVKKEKPSNIKVDIEKLANSFNDLINDFTKYANNNNLNNGVNNINNSTNYYVNNNNLKGESTSNNSIITKKVNLRGAIASLTYIDVTYMVTDPQDKYQAVYLLVTGDILGVQTTQKILLDKYETTTRISNLSLSSEYSISLGYVEVTEDANKQTVLIDNIEDVINVRTTKCDAKITIDKIKEGYVYFTFKMTKNYAFESGNIVLYSDDEKIGSVVFIPESALSDKGFSSKLELNDGTIATLKLENAMYNSKLVDVNIKEQFVMKST